MIRHDEEHLVKVIANADAIRRGIKRRVKSAETKQTGRVRQPVPASNS